MTSPPRVMIVGLNYPPEVTGIAPYTGAAARMLAERGYEVHVMTARPHYPSWRAQEGFGGWRRIEKESGVTVNRFWHYIPRRPKGAARLISELSFGLRVFFARWGRPDVVLLISPALFASVVVKLRQSLFHQRVPVLIWVQDIYSLGMKETGEGGRLSRTLVKQVESAVLSAADRVMVIHPRFADYARETLGVAADRIEVVRNWSHIAEFDREDRQETRSWLNWADDEIVVVHAGNMGTKQGLENVVDAGRIADLEGSRVRFVLIGDGSERASLEVKAAGIDSVRFLPTLNSAVFHHVLAAADVLIVNEKPGVAAMAAPSKLSSYMSSGVPIVAATDLLGITASEVSAAGAGVVVSAGDPRDLFDAVVRVVSQPDRGRAQGASGLRYWRDVYSPARSLDHLADVVEGLAQRAPFRGRR